MFAPPFHSDASIEYNAQSTKWSKSHSLWRAIDPKTPTRVSAFLLLGAVFMFNGTLWCLFLAWFAGSVSQKVRGNPRAQVVLKRGTGALFIGLGAKLAVDR